MSLWLVRWLCNGDAPKLDANTIRVCALVLLALSNNCSMRLPSSDVGLLAHMSCHNEIRGYRLNTTIDQSNPNVTSLCSHVPLRLKTSGQPAHPKSMSTVFYAICQNCRSLHMAYTRNKIFAWRLENHIAA